MLFEDGSVLVALFKDLFLLIRQVLNVVLESSDFFQRFKAFVPLVHYLML